ncbi:MAG: hypothetical protein K6T75_06900 [Acetobacteraceae bacterium]|nr:hypothetical protein [Acetobacteraceae bacterium]
MGRVRVYLVDGRALGRRAAPYLRSLVLLAVVGLYRAVGRVLGGLILRPAP